MFRFLLYKPRGPKGPPKGSLFSPLVRHLMVVLLSLQESSRPKMRRRPLNRRLAVTRRLRAGLRVCYAYGTPDVYVVETYELDTDKRGAWLAPLVNPDRRSFQGESAIFESAEIMMTGSEPYMRSAYFKDKEEETWIHFSCPLTY